MVAGKDRITAIIGQCPWKLLLCSLYMNFPGTRGYRDLWDSKELITCAPPLIVCIRRD